MKTFFKFCFFVFLSTSVFGQGKKTTQTVTNKPFVLGEIVVLPSKVLNEERTLNIYLPEGYNPKDTTRYPVIYLLDGSADEDFIHVVGLVQFGNFEWVNLLPKSIVVGIGNVDRRRDFTSPTTVLSDKELIPTGGKSETFISFIESELQPYMEKSYKTSTARTIIGQSLGGLLATEILLKKPYLFSNYVIISPSLWWNDGAILNLESSIYTADFNQRTQVYIGVGKEGLTPTLVPRVMEVDANVLADKLNQSKSTTIQVHFDYLPLNNHATIMHQAVFNAFSFLNAGIVPSK